MKLIILRLNTATKPSPISEGVMEIWINSQPFKGINLTKWHTQARRAPRVATIHDVTKKPARVLPRPSAVFHAYASADTPWVTQTRSHCTPRKRGTVLTNSSTHEATQFGDSICPVCASTFRWLFNRAQPMRALINTGGGYHFGAPNFISDHPSSFPSSILHFPLIVPPNLQLCQSFDLLAKPHRTCIDRKGPITSVFHRLIFYR
jgi:hypothetical protein